MSDLITATSPLSRPYLFKKSRLTTTTKVYTSKYVCDLPSIKVLLQSINDKLDEKSRSSDDHDFNFLISFSDNTHSDGSIEHILSEKNLDTDKRTERIVLNWKVKYYDLNIINEIEVTVRISNPINPLIFLQAALSKSPSEIDNIEFEMGSTCVTVEGADQSYAEEIFLRTKNWMNARSKPYTYMDIGGFYKKYEWVLDQSIISLIPILLVTVISFYISEDIDIKTQIAFVPVLVAFFFVFKSIGIKLINRMSSWAKRASFIGLFSVTQGDKDYLSEMIASSKNGSIKIGATLFISIFINIISGLACWYLIYKFIDI